jgi:hypothetical protein
VLFSSEDDQGSDLAFDLLLWTRSVSRRVGSLLRKDLNRVQVGRVVTILGRNDVLPFIRLGLVGSFEFVQLCLPCELSRRASREPVMSWLGAAVDPDLSVHPA